MPDAPVNSKAINLKRLRRASIRRRRKTSGTLIPANNTPPGMRGSKGRLLEFIAVRMVVAIVRVGVAGLPLTITDVGAKLLAAPVGKPEQGQPISGKFEVDEGNFQLSIYTAQGGGGHSSICAHLPLVNRFRRTAMSLRDQSRENRG